MTGMMGMFKGGGLPGMPGFPGMGGADGDPMSLQKWISGPSKKKPKGKKAIHGVKVTLKVFVMDFA